MPQTVDSPIPVTLLTGFLGSGKTTLLNQLVRQPGMNRTLVVINEFGEIGLDHQLFSATSETELVALDSGCLCCTVRGDLVRTLRDVTWRFSRQGKRQFDRLVIETTGLADPAPILHTLMTDARLAQNYRLDGIVTTVDAAHAISTLESHDEAIKQAAMADRLLITKTDQADPAALTAVRQRLTALNTGAQQIEVSHGVVDAALLIDLGIDHRNARKADIERWLGDEDRPDKPAMTGLQLGPAVDTTAPSSAVMPAQPAGDPNRHDHRIHAHCFTLDTPIDPARLDTWLNLMVSLISERMLRVKGLLNIVGQDRPTIIHGVQHIFHPPTRLDAWPDDDRRSRLVFITQDLPRESIEGLLAVLN